MYELLVTWGLMRVQWSSSVPPAGADGVYVAPCIEMVDCLGDDAPACELTMPTARPAVTRTPARARRANREVMGRGYPGATRGAWSRCPHRDRRTGPSTDRAPPDGPKGLV